MGVDPGRYVPAVGCEGVDPDACGPVAGCWS